MSVEMFLKVDGIQGEANDKTAIKEGLSGAIEILAWSWGLSSSGENNEEGKSPARIQDISITKWIDSSSTVLVDSIMSGKAMAEAELVVVRSEQYDSVKRENRPTQTPKYLTYKFKNIKISSMSMGGSGGEDKFTENISFSFDSFEFSYQQANKEQTDYVGEGIKTELYSNLYERCGSRY